MSFSSSNGISEILILKIVFKFKILRTRAIYGIGWESVWRDLHLEMKFVRSVLSWRLCQGLNLERLFDLKFSKFIFLHLRFIKFIWVKYNSIAWFSSKAPIFTARNASDLIISSPRSFHSSVSEVIWNSDRFISPAGSCIEDGHLEWGIVSNNDQLFKVFFF